MQILFKAGVICGCFFLLLTSAWAAPKADLWPRWQAHDPASTQTVDHRAWDAFLAAYLVVDHPSGVNMVNYAGVTSEDRAALQAYLDALQTTPVSERNRNEQMAYWINFYNALTVAVILDHYPVDSIRRINISPGFFSRGPWDAPLAAVEGEPLTLNDMEHRILRPIWNDPRIHYAVNCASIGCPDLQLQAYTSANLEIMLERAAREFVNHPRGVDAQGRRLRLSSIYDWFSEDFGRNEQELLEHLTGYADEPLASALRTYSGRISYHYDWDLNQAP
jgi:hypothetical protein